jgi:hypothetical protein
MKNRFLLLLAPLVLCLFIAAAVPQVPTTSTGAAIFSQTTDADGIVTTISYGRVQPAQDGTLNMVVYPWVRVTTPSGRVLRDELDTAHPFAWTLTTEQAASVNILIKAAYDAANPPPAP